jgi:hypothetical protein
MVKANYGLILYNNQNCPLNANLRPNTLLFGHIEKNFHHVFIGHFTEITKTVTFLAALVLFCQLLVSVLRIRDVYPDSRI